MRTALLLILLLPLTAHAAVINVNSDTALRNALQSAKPGDDIVLAPGDYKGNLNASNLAGTAEKPITLRGATDKNNKPTSHIAGGNTSIHLSKIQHIELRDLELSGAKDNGLNIDDGGIIDQQSHHVTLKNLVVHDLAGKGNNDNIKLSGVDDFTIDSCNISAWGAGGSGIDMVGCHNGTIINSTFKNGGSNAVQAKGASANITIQSCTFENAGERAINLGGSTGMPFFRPAMQNKKDAYEAKNLTVQGCTFIGSQAPIAFVGVDTASVRFNTFYLPEKWIIRILQETRDPNFVPCRNGIFQNNIIVFNSKTWREGGINIGPNTAPDTFKFSNNLWFCHDAPNRSAPKLPSKETDAILGQDPQFTNPAQSDFSLKPTSPAKSQGAANFHP